MQKFDTFSKPLQEFQVKTRTGGLLSIVTVVTIVCLMFSEIMFYMEIDQRDEMIVDLGQDTKSFVMEMDFWFPDLPCEAAGINLVHSKNQDNMMFLEHVITKHRRYAVPILNGTDSQSSVDKSQEYTDKIMNSVESNLESGSGTKSNLLDSESIISSPGNDDSDIDDGGPDSESSSYESGIRPKTSQKSDSDKPKSVQISKLGVKNVKWLDIGTPIRAGLHRICGSAGDFQDSLERSLRNSDNHNGEKGQNQGPGSETSGSSSSSDLDHNTRKERCMSCYGAKNDVDVCCNTCDSLREAFKEAGWSDKFDNQKKSSLIYEQCAAEDYKMNPAQEHEGCSIKARVKSRKVPGIVQIGLQHDFNKERLHKNFVEKALNGYVSFSHDINTLSFGPEFPGYVSVLTGQKRRHESVPLIESWSTEPIESQSEHWQYDLHLIPTDTVTAWGTVTESHQYSATYYVKGLNVIQRHRDLVAPGVNFKYEFTAFRVRWLQSYKPFSHFLTNICAILGGIYAFFGMLDNLIHQIASKNSYRKTTLCL